METFFLIPWLHSLNSWSLREIRGGSRFYGYEEEDGEGLAARAVHQKPDGSIVVAGWGAIDSEEPYHSRLLVFQLREDIDGDGDSIVDLEWQRELNPEAVWGNIDFEVTDMTGTPGGGLIVAGYYPSPMGENHDPLLMRLNEEGDIPPDCLLDPSPPLVEVYHAWEFDTILEEPNPITTTAGTETEVTPLGKEILLRDDCRPCVKRVNVNIPPEMAGDGETWETAIADLQDGIDAAAIAGANPDPTWVDPGYCEVWVAQGEYYVYDDDPADTIQMKAGVHVYGGFSGGTSPDSYGWEGSREDRNWELNITRIIGADGPTPTARVHHVVTAPVTNPSTLDGFHVLGGRANGDPGLDRWGGGMVNVFSSPKIANCTFYDNIAWWGGAMANVFAAPDVVNCTFRTSDNDPAFNQPNAAFAGGAIFNWGWAPWSGDGPTVDGCAFADNYAKYFYGGGIHNQNSPSEIVDSTFIGNHAYIGGGVSIGQSIDGMGAPSIEACTFNDNVASRWWDTNNGGFGGAMAVFSGASVLSSGVVIENSLFHDNSAGGPQGAAIITHVGSYFSAMQITNCTIANNATGGVRWDTVSPMMYNDILWNNGLHEIAPDCTAGAFVYYSDVMGGAGCEGFTGNISSNPLIDETSFELNTGSPCIDAADPTSAPLTDITGAYRDPAPDMGAFEYFPE